MTRKNKVLLPLFAVLLNLSMVACGDTPISSIKSSTASVASSTETISSSTKSSAAASSSKASDSDSSVVSSTVSSASASSSNAAGSSSAASSAVVSSTASNIGAKTYTFEAEYCPCILDMSGAGYSGGATGKSMILKDNYNAGASNGYYVSYLYIFGLTLEFNIVSSTAASNVTFAMRLTAEAKDISIDGSSYAVNVNTDSIGYDTISFTNVPSITSGELHPFNDYVISTSVNLKQGTNKIQLITMNNEPMGGTMAATAPMVDAIKLTTSSTLTWPEESKSNIPEEE